MPCTVVVLSARLDGVLPAAALPALRAAAVVLADASVPVELAAAAGALPLVGEPPDDAVVLTTDPDGGPEGTLIGAPEPAGARLLDAVAVMDRLRTPDGCPWDAEQTHLSLLPYLVEECYELYQVIEDGDRAAMREELGDVLLQVLFHSRLAAEDRGDPFDVDDVADGLVAKLVGRHPHVFGPHDAATERIDSAPAQERRWEELKRIEKQRESSVDGVPLGQPAVALAAKLAGRTVRAGLPHSLLPSGPELGDQLFALAAGARLAGLDPESELRRVAQRFAASVRDAECAARRAGLDPHALDVEAWLRHWPG